MLGILIALTLAGADASACGTLDATLPPELAGWAERAAPASATLTLGSAATVALSLQDSVNFAAPPERVPTVTGRRGASIEFTVPRDGLYRVALGDRAWVDVVGPDGRIASSAHGHGPACTSIRKVVTFPLRAGRHVLQISDADVPAIAVLIAPVE